MSKNVTLKVASLMGGPGAGEPMDALVVEVSGSGIRLKLPLPIPCGAEVEIEDTYTRILGETLRCDSQGDGYIVAVRVSETTSVADSGPRAIRSS
jgi:hypothetical protein